MPQHFEFPRKETTERKPSPIFAHTQSDSHQMYSVSSPDSSSISPSPSPSPLPPIHIGGTSPSSISCHSEPPPDLEIDTSSSQLLTLPTQPAHLHGQSQLLQPVEYSWEWGRVPAAVSYESIIWHRWPNRVTQGHLLCQYQEEQPAVGEEGPASRHAPAPLCY